MKKYRKLRPGIRSPTINPSKPEIPSVVVKPTNNIKKDIPDPIRHPPKISVLLIIESPHYRGLAKMELKRALYIIKPRLLYLIKATR